MSKSFFRSNHQTFTVDSGQVSITPEGELASASSIRFVDKRQYLLKDTGQPIDEKYLSNFAAPIPEVGGASLNELIQKNLVELKIKELCDQITYEGCCDQTLYNDKSCGLFSNNEAFCTSTTFGDGVYSVLVDSDQEGFVVDLCSYFLGDIEPAEPEDVFDMIEWIEKSPVVDEIGILKVSGALEIGDPAYSESEERVCINVKPGEYKIEILWPNEKAMRESRQYLVRARRVKG